MNHLIIGIGRSDITPAPGTPHAGWGAQTHQRGVGADLPLYATALVLSDNARQIALVDVDYGGFDDEWLGSIVGEIAKLTQIPRDHIRLSYTHTHSGPNTFRLQVISEGLDMVKSYMQGLAFRIAGAVWQAQQNLKPARVGATKGECGINVNRRLRLPDGRVVIGRNWQGAVDRTVRVIRFDGLDEKPIATIVHYACHPTIMAWQNQYVTPDYPGMVRKVVEQQMGGVCLFLQGAAGNIGPRRGFTGDLAVYQNLGRILGLHAAALAAEIETLPRRESMIGLLESGTTIGLYQDEVVEPEAPTLDIRSRTLRLPIRSHPDPAELETKAEKLRHELSEARRNGSEEQIRAATARAVQAGMDAERASLYFGKRHIEWPLQGIRIGSIALLAVPGEPFIEIGQQIVKSSPFPHTLFSGYSNGGFGYLPTRAAFEEGGYEVNTSIFTNDAADVLVSEAIGLMQDLAAEGIN